MPDEKTKREHNDSSREQMEKHEPPRTTKGGITAPKFGSAGSGGAELEPLPEQHDDEDESKIHDS